MRHKIDYILDCYGQYADELRKMYGVMQLVGRDEFRLNIHYYSMNIPKLYGYVTMVQVVGPEQLQVGYIPFTRLSYWEMVIIPYYSVYNVVNADIHAMGINLTSGFDWSLGLNRYFARNVVYNTLYTRVEISPSVVSKLRKLFINAEKGGV